MRQPDLLDWQPPKTTRRFDDDAVQAATAEARLAKDELRRQGDALRRQAKSRGVL